MLAIEDRPVLMLVDQISGPQAWTRDTVSSSDWLVPLPEACLAELRVVLAELRRAPVPMFLLMPEEFELDACRGFMRHVKAVLDNGVMVAVINRLPVEEATPDESVALYWLLSTLLARPVAQKLNGQILYDVRDTGAELQPGSGIRPTVTNVDLTFHNDNSYNETPPDYVGLFCRQAARTGGVSRAMSVYTVHNELLRHAPDLLPCLYQPFWYDRHREHRDDEPAWFAAPIFEYDRALKARLALHEIYAGYSLRAESMDSRTTAALEAVRSVFERPELRIELTLEPGQIQYVNNRSTGHARTEFLDHPEPERKRHLVRLWLRDGGRRGYRG